MPPSPDRDQAPGPGGVKWPALLAVLAVAAAARLLPWSTFFTPAGVLLAADGDTAYHALRAEQIARDGLPLAWRDPGMSFPDGADVPWPPLLDLLVAGAARLTGPATPEHVAAAAALVPVAAGVAAVAVAWALAPALGLGPGWIAALLAALLPALVRQGFVGRADHHVLETLWSGLALLLLARGLDREASWRRSLALGAVLTLAFWSWPGSALYLLLLAAALAALHVALPAVDPAPGRAAGELARGAAVAALLLAASVAALGPPRALWSGRLTPITGLSAALSLATAGAAALLGWLRRRDPAAGPARRAAHLAVAAAVPALALLLLPGLRQGVLHAGTAVGAANPWYRTIPEFWPLLGSGRQPWTLELLLAAFAFGLTPLAALAAPLLLRGAWRERPERRAGLVLAAAWGVATLALVLARRRFEGYAAFALVLPAGWVVGELARRLAPRLGDMPRRLPLAAAGLALLAAAPALPVTLSGAVGELPDGTADKGPLLAWLRGVPARPGREAVLAGWAQGHEIRWWARRPVVSTPFGTDIDPRSLADEAAFLAARDPAAARALLDRRRVGYLLLENPVRELAALQRLAPGSPELVIEELDPTLGARWALHAEVLDLVASRLHFFDGASPTGEPALDGYRLVGESPTPVEVAGLRAQRFKLFEVVEGALLRVRGLAPGAVVTARLGVRTNQGRTFSWATGAAADASGTATLRVPYATGRNGLAQAGPCSVSDGARTESVSVSEQAVLLGAGVDVALR